MPFKSSVGVVSPGQVWAASSNTYVSFASLLYVLCLTDVFSITVLSHSTHFLVEVSGGFLFSVFRADVHMLTAEDVLGDLGVRQAMRAMPKDARL